jgi:hypothetical protein
MRAMATGGYDIWRRNLPVWVGSFLFWWGGGVDILCGLLWERSDGALGKPVGMPKMKGVNER